VKKVFGDVNKSCKAGR